MIKDANMLDQDMDIDVNVPPVPPNVPPVPQNVPPVPPNVPPVPRHDGISFVRISGPLRGRRDRPNANDTQGNTYDSSRLRRGGRVQKTSSNSHANRHRDPGRAEQQRKTSNAQRTRNQRIQKAVADGTFQIGALGNPGEDASSSAVGHGEPQQIQRLNKNIVAQALFAPIPGLTFDPALFPFNETDMANMVQAMESFQMHLARKGMVLLTDKADSLLRAFARTLLAFVLSWLKKPGCNIAAVDFWTQVATYYHRSKNMRWLTSEVFKLLESVDVDTLLKPGKGRSFKAYRRVVQQALEAPGQNLMVDDALAEVNKQTPPFIVAQPSTLRSLMGHFAAARSRYLANLRMSDGPGKSTNPGPHVPTSGFSRPPRDHDQYDSSEDEEDGLPGGVFDGGVEEDDGQVEGGVPSRRTQWFLVGLDEWNFLKKGQQQAGVDADMLSALDLGDAMQGF